jgi:hypothetical protein
MSKKTAPRQVVESTISNHPFFAMERMASSNNMPELMAWIRNDWKQRICPKMFQAPENANLHKTYKYNGNHWGLKKNLPLSNGTRLMQDGEGHIELYHHESDGAKMTREAKITFLSDDHYIELERVLFEHTISDKGSKKNHLLKNMK